MDYLLGQQRRRLRRIGASAAAVLAIVILVTALTLVAHKNGPPKTAPARLTAAQQVAQAARHQAGLKSESATVNEQISGKASGTITGTVELQRQPLLLGMNLTESVAGQTATIRGIITSSSMYLKLGTLPGVPSYLAAKWLEVPLTALSQSSPFASLQQELQNANPASQTALLGGAGQLRAAGSQIVGGVSTTRYDGSITPSAAVKSLPAAQRAVLSPYLHEITGDMTFSVWIDGGHNVRKLQLTESIAGVTTSAQCTYGSFNEPVKIALPTPSQVYAPPASTLND